MSLVLGVLNGLGLTFVAAPFLWKHSAARQHPQKTKRSVWLRSSLSAAGFPDIPVPVFAAFCLLLGIFFAGIAHVLRGLTAVSCVALLVGLVFPVLLVRWQGARRTRNNRAVWPDLADHIVSGIRSGFSLPDSLAVLARTGPSSTRSAFSHFETQYAQSDNFFDCLDVLKEQLADPVADRVIETLRMARQLGGAELPAVLTSLSRHLRAEAAVLREVDARQSWIRNAAKVGVAAPWILLVLLSGRPEAQEAYNSPGGVVMICLGFFVSILGYRAMMRLGRIPVEPRWFR